MSNPNRRTLPATSLTPYPGNPRRGDLTLIKQSLLEHGQYRPAVVNNTPEGRIVLTGNHMVQAMRQLDEEHPGEGWGNIWVHEVTLTKEQARRLALTDNRTTDNSTYDETALLAELQSLASLEGTGWVEDDLQALLDTPPAPQADEDAYPEEFPYPGMVTLQLALMPNLWQQWQHHAHHFDTPEEALEHLLDHGPLSE